MHYPERLKQNDMIGKYITTSGLQTEKQFETEFATIFVAVKE